jgi:hypothetical protein
VAQPPKPSKLKVGVDVPWVTSWSGEEQLGVSRCASVDGALAFAQADRPGLGRPLYSQNHVRRQRESVRRMLCPMCGEPTPADDRWTLLAKPETAASLKAKGLDFVLPPGLAPDHELLNAGSISPLHRACADRSSMLCPHIRGDISAALRPFPKRWSVAPLMVKATPQIEHFRARAASQSPVMVILFLQLCGIA